LSAATIIQSFMPRQNRVTPFSEIVSTEARGTLMGNRGCLHNDRGEIRRSHQLKRWIICVLSFKGRQRAVMTPGHYTELFFLDEATALAAGHRPCAECQRERFNLFRTTMARAIQKFKGIERPLATMIDDVLHEERRTAEGKKRIFPAPLDDLPDGTFITQDGDNAYLVGQDKLLRWTPFGYEDIVQRPNGVRVRVLTPPSVVRILSAGYPVAIHPTACIGKRATR